MSVHKYIVYQSSVLSFPVLKLNCGVGSGKVTRLSYFMAVFQLHILYTVHRDEHKIQSVWCVRILTKAALTCLKHYPRL